jgi:hypothetical protein
LPAAATSRVASLGCLNALSQVGVVIYMFLTCPALNHETLREPGYTLTG